MSEPATPRPAATVVVVRSAPARARAPFEVMLLRRSAAMSFVAGAHVFPGGTVDAADTMREPASRCDGLDGPRRFPDLDPAQELAHAVAGARELLEEAGVLLARRDGRWATPREAEAVREQLAAGSSLEECIRAGGWRLALDALVAFAHIVTPRSEPRRFDTRFFLAELPPGAEARQAGAESDELVWASPAEAMERGLRGDVVLLPPTWVTLMQLDSFDSVQSLVAWARGRRIVRVEPVLTPEAAGRRSSSLPVAGALDVPAPARGRLVRFTFEEGAGWRPLA